MAAGTPDDALAEEIVWVTGQPTSLYFYPDSRRSLWLIRIDLDGVSGFGDTEKGISRRLTLARESEYAAWFWRAC